MKSSKDRAFLISLGISVVAILVVYFVMIAPKQGKISSAKNNIEKVKKNDLSDAGSNAKKYETLLSEYNDRNQQLGAKRADLLAELLFEMPANFEIDDSAPLEVQFPIIKSRIVASLRDAYPGFPFQDNLGFPDLPSVGKDEYMTLFEKLAIARHLLIVLGDSGVNAVRSFSHPDKVEKRDEEAKATIFYNYVSVSFEGSLKSILESIRQLNAAGKYLIVDDFSIHPSSTGYSLACDLKVCSLRVEFDKDASFVEKPTEKVKEDPQPTKTPEETPEVAPTPESTPEPKATPAEKETPKPTKTKSNPMGW